MEKMWSPWRSQYIQSFKEKGCSKTGCVFCDAQEDADSEDSLVVYQDELTFVIMNLYPYNNGHIMVVPRRHISDFKKLTTEEHSEIMANLDKSIRAMDSVLKPQGYNMGVNIGREAGAGIDTHLHFHLVPRWSGDTNFMPVVGEVKIISQELMECKQKLIEAFKKL